MMRLIPAITALSLLFVGSEMLADERPPETKTLQDGVFLTEIVSHPDIATPTGIDVGEDGRIWAVACHTHFPPENYPGPRWDQILVFDRDGTNRQVFYEKTFHTMDLELGSDGWVYLAERDRIFRIRDTDADGQADTEELLAELITEADYPHNALSALAWHTDGSLYFGLGENYGKSWVLRSVDGREFTGRGEGGIFRCQPDGKGMERLARGMWNPFGIEVREDGEVFAVENDPGERPPCRLLHVVEGADFGFQRAYGNEAQHPFVCWNGELRGTLPMVRPVGEGPCGLAAIGAGLLATSWSDHRIDFHSLSRNGASYSAERIQLVEGSRYFRPVCIAPEPWKKEDSRRSWVFTDWVDGNYSVHGYGRIWRLEIDLEVASRWMKLVELEPENEKSKIFSWLKDANEKFDEEELFSLVESTDAYVSSAALERLATVSLNWKTEDFSGKPEAQRVWSAVALHRSGKRNKDWLPLLLKDPSVEVRFEALRWIADEQLTDYLPAVEEVLADGKLDFSLFEAAMAARNTLLGFPEKGVRDEEMLLAKVSDSNASPKLRAYALRLLPRQSQAAPKDGKEPELRLAKGLTIALLRELLAVGDNELSLETVRVLAGVPSLSGKILVQVANDSSLPDILRAEAVAGLATVVDENREVLFALAGDKEAIVREEALRCFRSASLSEDERNLLKKRKAEFPDSEEACQAVLDPASIGKERPPLNDVDAWMKRLAAVEEEADPERGRRLFFHKRLALCSNCHRFDGRGNVVGPDLSRVRSLGNREWLLHSILDPNWEIAPEYLPRYVLLKDGSSFTGIRLRSSKSEVLRDLNGQNRSFNRDDIESMQELQVSFMPPGLSLALTDRELRDLLAFLENGE